MLRENVKKIAGSLLTVCWARLAQADAFILVVGEKGVGDWQELEYDEALDKRVKSLISP
jgi:hypothetical protein